MREKLIELLAKYFDIGGSYAYNLTRVKSAFDCGTMGFDDFEEFDEETVADIADHLIANGVTVQKWIPVTERLPKEWDRVLVCTSANTTNVARLVEKVWRVTWNLEHIESVTHWMPLPEQPKGE